MQALTDLELIESFKQGDMHAFNLLVWRWQKPVLNFLVRFVGNIPEAEDLAQQTFLKVFKKLRGLKDPRKFSPWLYRIASNQARDHLRQRKKRAAVSLNRSIDGTSEGETRFDQILADPTMHNPEQLLDQNHLQVVLNRSLQEISEEQRMVIILRFYQGLKFQEIADVLDIPEGTAKTRFYFGLKALRSVFKRRGLTKEVWQA
ncbi:MAG: sigma-70 family RNA polymerase sigma factor [Calditrichaeota bacterium]|nr:sigma-70 family RNA polymerase sigma factor [Calditrichota bacterium]